MPNLKLSIFFHSQLRVFSAFNFFSTLLLSLLTNFLSNIILTQLIPSVAFLSFSLPLIRTLRAIVQYRVASGKLQRITFRRSESVRVLQNLYKSKADSQANGVTTVHNGNRTVFTLLPERCHSL